MITTLEAPSETELSSSFVRSKIIEEYRRRKERWSRSRRIKCYESSNFGATKKPGTCYFCKRKGHHRNKCIRYAEWKTKKGLSGNQNDRKANVVKSDDTSDELLFLIGRANGWILDSGAICHIINVKILSILIAHILKRCQLQMGSCKLA